MPLRALLQEHRHMAVIVAGKLIIKPGSRDEFIEKSREAILLARKNDACADFSVSPDSIDRNRVNIFERWKSRSELNTLVFYRWNYNTEYFTITADSRVSSQTVGAGSTYLQLYCLNQ